MTWTYFAIRHKETGMLMPEVQRRGYSHWNPTTGKFPDTMLPTPRLIDTRRKAARCIQQWINNPNASYGYRQGYDGREDYQINIKPDGRSIDDLEIVEIELSIKE